MKMKFASFVSIMNTTTRRFNVKYISATPLKYANLSDGGDIINQSDPTDFLYVYNGSDRKIKRFWVNEEEGACTYCVGHGLSKYAISTAC